MILERIYDILQITYTYLRIYIHTYIHTHIEDTETYICTKDSEEIQIDISMTAKSQTTCQFSVRISGVHALQQTFLAFSFATQKPHSLVQILQEMCTENEAPHTSLVRNVHRE
jgi:hypothetical protein